MQTDLASFIKKTPEGQEADSILRACVHCGFCTATCPTYQLLGDELDGPRGRIYLIKQVLEGKTPSSKTQQHLDRCLTCRACETTCPSGVRYARLLDIGREVVEAQVSRPLWERLIRASLRAVLPYPRRFTPLLRLGRMLSPVLPAAMKRHLPSLGQPTPWPTTPHSRKMLILEGCVQPTLAPEINASTAWVLDRLNISLLKAPNSGCCGAINHHLSDPKPALVFMRRNIDAWWPYIEAGAEAIVITASGCGAMIKEYGILLKEDPLYATKAAKVAAITKDISEILTQEDRSALIPSPQIPRRITFQSPCTLQHGQQLNGVVEKLLQEAGFDLTEVENAHLCCGSAGTYSILQQDLSQRLLANKLVALEAGSPQIIATANIGCLTHLQSQSSLPVKHWITLFDPRF
ncbi:glycolate oxidase iron-sulfur subunit [Candidatus Nitrosoglobus terrae]|uniref:Glycolate oxidase iron-sulfur subunit n=1 Tax=Candidatus Nitrosoglobus terrae TaxID=1630141 RepID=A0A1Q2SMB2_9GAMM|nr:glycolate oxidase subunit GlcF [Candidatus Nitrosoglobus terrae]BAW80261.1 glycolate oxidase iron-sulfur subunit [Candidatus Nitrosoglobus terrae]